MPTSSDVSGRAGFHKIGLFWRYTLRNMALPEQLINFVGDGEAVLFVGSGASRDVGAPTGAELAKLLATEFGKGLPATDDLQNLVDILESYPTVSRTEVDRAILRALRKFSPGPGHKLITTMRWRGIFTTNFDELIENSYRSVLTAGARPAQELNLVVGGSNDSYSADDPGMVSVFKLNGCLSQIDRFPLVLSTNDFRNTKKRQTKWLRYLRQLANRHAIIFVGYSFVDGIGIRLLKDIQAASPYGREREMFAVDPAFSNGEVGAHLQNFNVTPIGMKFGDFFTALDHAGAGRANKQLLAQGIERFVTTSGAVTIDDRLRMALEPQVEILSPRGPQRDARRFLSGVRPDAEDLRGHNDIDRDKLAALVALIEQTLKQDDYVRPMVAVLGNGGAGKTTLASRAAFEVANKGLATSFVLRDQHDRWNASQLLELVHHVQGPVVFVVNDLEQPKRISALRRLRAEVSSARVPVVFLLSCQKATWNLLARGAAESAAEFFIEGTLSRAEATALVAKLRENHLLKTPGLDAASLVRKVAEDCDGHLVVAMLELATEGRFKDILLLEYENLSPRAKEVYQYVALLHQYGISLPEYILNAVTVRDYNVFANEVMKVDSELVFVQDLNRVSKRLYFRTRHPLIAKTIVDVVLPKVEDRVRKLLEIVRALAGTDEDRHLAIQILTHDRLRKDIGDASHVDQLFDLATEIFPGDRTVILHLGKWEVRKGNLQRARDLLEFGRSLEPRDSYLVNELGICALRQAQQENQAVIRDARYNEALSRFHEKERMDPGSHYGFLWEAKCHLSRAQHQSRDGRLDPLSDALDAIRRGLSSVRPDERAPLDELKPRILHDLGGSQEIIADLMARATKEPLPYASWYHLLAVCYLEGRELKSARAAVESGLEVYGADPRLQGFLLELLERDLHTPETRERVRSIVRKTPSTVTTQYLEAVCRYYDDDFKGSKEAFDVLRETHFGLPTRVRVLLQSPEGVVLVKKGEWSFLGPRRLVREFDSGLRLVTDPVLWRQEPGVREVKYSVGFSLMGPRAIKPKPPLEPPAS